MKNSFSRTSFAVVVAVAVAGVWSTAFAGNSILGELELKAASKVEHSAGVWVDGQYVGHLDELKHKHSLVLVPGNHKLLFKLAGYQDVNDSILVEPGQRQVYRLSMAVDPKAVYPEKAETAKLRISVEPDNAAVFINGIYTGYVDRFNGRRGIRMRAGVYQVKIALPGYLPFETQMTLVANQNYEIKTTLTKASITKQTDGLKVTQARE